MFTLEKDMYDIRQKPYIKNAGVNKGIVLYRGPAQLIQDQIEQNVVVKIIILWYPNVRLCFETVIEKYINLDDAMLVTNQAVYNVKIIFINYTSHGKHSLKGIITNHNQFLSTGKTIYFPLINFRDYIGRTIVNNIDHTSFSKDKLLIENDDFKLAIEKITDYKNTFNALKENGGYAQTHNCFLSCNKGEKSQEQIISNLHYILAFVNGSWCGPNLYIQKNGRKRIYIYENVQISEYKYRLTAFGSIQGSELELVLNLMHEKMKDDKWQAILRHLIHTYIVCNDVSKITVEMATIIIQASLEMLSDFVLVEKETLISRNKFNDLRASEKIRKLLDYYKIPMEATNKIDSLHELSIEEEMDDVDFIVNLRNPYIHPSKNNRTKVKKYQSSVRTSIWQMSVWYLELSILKTINYSKRYCDRTITGGYERLVIVPWQK